MFPGFITLFKEDNKTHLYFFKGLLDDNKGFYYNDLSLSNCPYEYDQIINDDNSVEYIFKNVNIKSMNCKLINYKGQEKNIKIWVT